MTHEHCIQPKTQVNHSLIAFKHDNMYYREIQMKQKTLLNEIKIREQNSNLIQISDNITKSQEVVINIRRILATYVAIILDLHWNTQTDSNPLKKNINFAGAFYISRKSFFLDIL